MARDMLYDRLFRHAVRIPEAFRNWEKYFRGIPVYDLTETVPLLESVKTIAGIPKKFPHARMWAEWSYTVPAQRAAGGLDVALTTGVLVWGEEFSEPVHPGWLDDKRVVALYSMFMFLYRDGGEPLIYPAKYHGGILEHGTEFAYVEPDYYKGSKADWMSQMFLYTNIVPDSIVELDSGITRNPESLNRYTLSPWPLIKASALLNCRNIVTEETHSEKKHPMVKGERNHRPYCSYKVLKLEVPRRMAERNGESADGDDDGPKQRFHLCRGHFKNLQHERFKEKGWHWWPAHWRGSIELGRADKSYKLTPA